MTNTKEVNGMGNKDGRADRQLIEAAMNVFRAAVAVGYLDPPQKKSIDIPVEYVDELVDALCGLKEVT